MKKIVLLGLFFLLLFSCKNEHKIEKVERAFYYWKSNNWRFDEKLDTILKQTRTQKLYIKFFEVEHNELMGNIPISKNRIRIDMKGIEVVPTIFIKNDVFLKSSYKDLDLLADNINFLINKFKNEDYKKDILVSEFQMDCDWTIKTKDKYFYFLQKIKSLSKKTISCTLRLYPYKYRKNMGVPPVDKVTLMCYNLLNPLENPKQNSILDVDELAKYLSVSSKYPLHVDIALPIYSWMQLYQNNQFQSVMYNNHEYLLNRMKKIDNLWYEVTEDVQLDNCYIRVGDKIKYEEVTQKDIEKTIKLLKKNIEFDNVTTVSLFHLDEAPLQKYSNEEINSFYTSFSN